MGKSKKTFRQRLTVARKAKGLSIRGLAKISEVSAGYLSSLEKGLLPSMNVAETLEKKLDIEEGGLSCFLPSSSTSLINDIYYYNQDNIPKLNNILKKIEKNPHLLDKIEKVL